MNTLAWAREVFALDQFLRLCGLNEIGGYEFKEVLGKGKASVVCLFENGDGQKRVVKMLIAPRTESELHYFASEPKTLRTLMDEGFSHTPRVYTDCIKVDDLPIYYFTMEYVDGETLADYIESNPLPWNSQTALRVIACIANALSWTSSRNIVHRDLHPGNIMVPFGFEPDEEFRKDNSSLTIMDYGCHRKYVPKFLDQYIDDEQIESSFHITKGGYLRHFGAISTWSPEFLRNPHTVDSRHDIWAIGVLLFRFLTNEIPVRVSSFAELYDKLSLNFRLDWHFLDERKIHWAIKRFVMQLLSENPENRYPNGDIVRLCIGLSSNQLFEFSDEFIRAFLVTNGDCWICPRCRDVVFPTPSLCTNCGATIEPEGWINPFL